MSAEVSRYRWPLLLSWLLRHLTSDARCACRLSIDVRRSLPISVVVAVLLCCTEAAATEALALVDRRAAAVTEPEPNTAAIEVRHSPERAAKSPARRRFPASCLGRTAVPVRKTLRGLESLDPLPSTREALRRLGVELTPWADGSA